MSFEIVTLTERLVAGLTIPLAGAEVARRDLDLITFTWDRYLVRDRPGVRAAAYVAQDGRCAAVLGYEAEHIEDVLPGDVVTRIPAGPYAKFAVAGKPYDLTRTAWAEIVQAENTGEIRRSYTADLERCPGLDLGGGFRRVGAVIGPAGVGQASMMNASSSVRARSSGICTGGDFIRYAEAG
ncbi:GyrI-like domain-containing protein [Skermania piniformis]|uniref:GyrI-like domain-containing protein n=1 Tax=Skermania pinensis TaxID=39122 RepID=UPI001FE787E3|nr:GyrI-like domain-containing protein [Skermania piniformis]